MSEAPVLTSELRISRRHAYTRPELLEFVPVDGVRLEPGEIRKLAVVYRFAGCRGSGGGYASIPAGPTVAYSFGRIFRRAREIEVPFAVVFYCGEPLPRPDGRLITRGIRGAQPGL